VSRHLERLLKIDLLLRSSKRQTHQSLAAATEVSERTIRNDLAWLRDRFNAPLKYQRNNGWYYTDPDWRLPSISLSQGELFALTLGARMLEAYAQSAYVQELRSGIERLVERLPDKTWIDLQQLVNDRVLFRVGAEIDIEPQIWHDLEIACCQKRSVRINYYTAGRNAHSERIIDPYILHFSRGNPIVTGYCHNRKEPRWFRIDRIKLLELLKETFEIDPDFDREAHFADVFQHEAGGIPTAISIWFDAITVPYIRERRWHPSQKIEEHEDGSLTLNFIARGLQEVKRWVLYYGKGAVIKSPPELVEMIKDDLSVMNQHYSVINQD
jgi:predicted DNA-binding transcriptional regulator YafY